MKGDLGIEVVTYSEDNKDNPRLGVRPMTLVKTEGSKLYYSIDFVSIETGHFKFGFRVYPNNKDIPHRMDFAYVKWINK